MTWVRVKDVKPYIKARQYTEEYGLVKRLYRAKGKKYPLLSVSIYCNECWKEVCKIPFKGIRILIAYKSSKNSFWDSYEGNVDSYLPLELFDDLREMLKEAEDKLK